MVPWLVGQDVSGVIFRKKDSCLEKLLSLVQKKNSRKESRIVSLDYVSSTRYLQSTHLLTY